MCVSPHPGFDYDFVADGKKKIGKLELNHRPQSGQSGANPGAGETILRDRCIEYAIVAEHVSQPVSDAKDTAEICDVFAIENYIQVARHLLDQRFADGFSVRDGFHGSQPPPQAKTSSRAVSGRGHGWACMNAT